MLRFLPSAPGLLLQLTSFRKRNTCAQIGQNQQIPTRKIPYPCIWNVPQGPHMTAWAEAQSHWKKVKSSEVVVHGRRFYVLVGVLEENVNWWLVFLCLSIAATEVHSALPQPCKHTTKQ